MTLSVDTRNKRGPIRESGLLFSNDPGKRRIALYIKAVVKPYVEIKPRPFVHFLLEKGRTGTTLLRLRSLLPGKLRFTKTEISPSLRGRIRIVLSPAEEGAAYLLKVHAAGFEKIGTTRGRVMLHTDRKEKPVVSIPVVIVVSGPIRVIPEKLNFGAMDRTKYKSAVRRAVWLRNLRGDGLEIRGIDYDGKLVSVTLQERAKGKEYLLFVTVDPRRLPKGALQTRIVIRTNNSEMPAITIPVTGEVL